MATAPTMTIKIEITMATMGRLIKNLDISGFPLLERTLENSARPDSILPSIARQKRVPCLVLSYFDRSAAILAALCRLEAGATPEIRSAALLEVVEPAGIRGGSR